MLDSGAGVGEYTMLISCWEDRITEKNRSLGVCERYFLHYVFCVLFFPRQPRIFGRAWQLYI